MSQNRAGKGAKKNSLPLTVTLEFLLPVMIQLNLKSPDHSALQKQQIVLELQNLTVKTQIIQMFQAALPVQLKRMGVNPVCQCVR